MAPRKKKDEEVLDTGVHTDMPEAVGSSASTEDVKFNNGKVVFRIRNRNTPTGHSERVFSFQEHGEDYEKLADDFANANNSEILHRE